MGEQRDDVTNAAAQVAGRLTHRGVRLDGRESPDDLVTLLDAVEAFERAVQRVGGDLMVDEPPPGHGAQPDDRRFVLPVRHAGESASDYAARVAAGAGAIRRPRAK